MNDKNSKKLFYKANICWRCNGDRQFTTTCNRSTIIYHGEEYYPIKFGDEINTDYKDLERCYDCNVVKGGFHHSGCEVEECPKCNNPILICRCPGD